MSTLPINDLGAVLALTDDVQAAIDAGDWQLAAQIEAQRRRKLEELVASSIDAPPREVLRMTLEEQHRQSLRMIGEVHHHRRRLVREAAVLQSGFAAAGIYEAAAPADPTDGAA